MEQERKVRIDGELVFYKDKAPYVPSGHSVKGGLEYDEAEDKVKCHECGEWFHSLASHVVKGHQMMAADYKRQHGLKQSSALVSEGLRHALVAKKSGYYWEKLNDQAAMRAHMEMMQKRRRKPSGRRHRVDWSEYRNRHGLCHAQLLESVRALVETVGRFPRTSDLKEHGLLRKTLIARFGSLEQAVSLAVGRKYRSLPRSKFYSIRELKVLLQTFVKNTGKLPTESDFRRGLLPAKSTYIYNFGSWKAAVRKCGLTLRVPAGGEKLTANQVRRVRKLRAGGTKVRDIARRFVVSRSTVYAIVRGDTHSCVT